MKKTLAVISVLLMVISLAACGDNSEKSSAANDNNGVVSDNADKGNNISDSDKITVEKVRNAPETSTDDFITETVDGGVEIDRYIGESEIVVIPEEIDGMPVVAIGTNCFANNMELKGVKISDRVISIRTNAFVNCFNLEIFISGKNVMTMGDYVLSYCKSLKHLELNDSLTSLGMACFTATESLEEVYIPASVTDVGVLFLAEDKATIICESGSAAEAYAQKYGVKYEIK